MGTLKLPSNGTLYSSTMIGTLAVDERAVTFGTARRGEEGTGWDSSPPTPILAVPNVTAHPTHQWPVYQLYIIRGGTILTVAL